MRLVDKAKLFPVPSAVRRAMTEAAVTGAPRTWATALSQARGQGGRLVREAVDCDSGSFYCKWPASVIADIPLSATFLEVDGQAPDLPYLSRLKRLEVLSIGPVSPRVLRAISGLPNLRVLLLGHTPGGLAGLRDLPRLEHVDLSITTSANIRPLAALPRLRTMTLWIRGPGRIDLRSVAGVSQLRGLAVAPLRDWDPLRVPTLSPLSRLSYLTQLDLRMVRVDDGSLRPLRRLPLTRLGLSNYYATSEFAGIVSKRPGIATIEGWEHGPWWVVPSRPKTFEVGTCKRCQQWVLGMTTGKPVRRLCPECDKAAVDRVLARWASLLSAAKGEVDAA